MQTLTKGEDVFKIVNNLIRVELGYNCEYFANDRAASATGENSVLCEI